MVKYYIEPLFTRVLIMTADFISAKPTPDLAFISQHLFTAILWVNDELSISWLNAQADP